jgi:hypothetical protein
MIRFTDDPALELVRRPMTPDPSPDEISAACLVIQSRWTDSIREDRAVGKRRQRWEVVEMTEVELVEY